MGAGNLGSNRNMDTGNLGSNRNMGTGNLGSNRNMGTGINLQQTTGTNLTGQTVGANLQTTGVGTGLGNQGRLDSSIGTSGSFNRNNMGHTGPNTNIGTTGTNVGMGATGLARNRSVDSSSSSSLSSDDAG